jgi:hypothetical protein
VIVSALFLFSAYSKLSGDPMAIAGFAQAHLPIWFMYFIGIAEVLGAIGLWVKKFRTWSIYGLIIILAGAIITTAIFVSLPMALFPLIVAILLGIISWLNKIKNSVS